MSVAMETENVEIIKAMVASGLGVTVIPYAAIARDVRHAPLRLRRACAAGGCTGRRAGST